MSGQIVPIKRNIDKHSFIFYPRSSYTCLNYLVISFIVIKSFIASLALFCYSMHHMALFIFTYYRHLNEDKLLYIYKQLPCF